MTVPPPAAPVADPPRRGFMRTLGVDTAYAIAGFPIAIAAFVLVITGFSVGLGTLVIWVGLPILAGTLYVARGFAQLERMRIAQVLNHAMIPGIYKKARPGAGTWRRLLTPFADVQSWLDLTHAILRFPFAILSFVVTVTWWTVALAGLTNPLWLWAIPRDNPDNVTLPELLGLGDAYRTELVFYLGVGVFFAITLPFILRLVTLMESGLAHGMLNSVARLRAQVDELTEVSTTARAQKAAAVSAEATALRRLERDIHDGPQQRLVRLAVDLGRAQQQLDTDPDAARRTMAEALDQTREALDELRALGRGIAPPILTDRGLTAAVTALAGRCTVPVALAVPDLPRLDPATEQTAYFVIAESLTNVAKHSHANGCRVVLTVVGDQMEITVTDDGVGGAHPAKGSGLAGLVDRVHSAGGELSVVSPTGGPTTIYAVVPCLPNGVSES
ncbi:sensor histidine kinase [Luedemannella flava]|uniref:histidine kinase n=1 Tax=Luedemannella flava TaxID=349316 RepID=A0ABP4YGD6_9ACTN